MTSKHHRAAPSFFQRRACTFKQRLRLRGGATAMTDEEFDAMKHVRNVEMQASLGGFFDQKAESDDSSWPTMYVCHKVGNKQMRPSIDCMVQSMPCNETKDLVKVLKTNVNVEEIDACAIQASA